MMRSLLFAIIAGISCLILSVNALAEPAISGISGTLAPGSTFRITGSGFGTKDPAQPLVWADFESGLHPTPLGIRSAWEGTAQVFFQTEDCPGLPVGSRCAKAVDGSGVWTLLVRYDSWSAANGRSYIYRLAKKNFLITDGSQNWKTLRLWADGFKYPNLYVAESNGRIYVENIGGLETGYWANIRTGTMDWVQEEYLMKASSEIDRKDGTLEIRYNGLPRGMGSIMTLFSQSPLPIVMNFVAHFVKANAGLWTPAWSPDNRVWVDDIYADTTWARVMLGNGPTYGECTALVPQIPSQWSDSQIVAYFHRGRFTPGERVYLYVVDSEGRTSQGLSLVVPGGNAVAPSAPTRLRMAR
jgi:hypothetical protein